MDNNIIIFNYKKANKLIEDGYTLLKIKSSNQNKGMLVFIFKREQSLEKLLGI